MFNSQNLGALVVKEDPHVQNWEDARYGIQEMFIEESYGFGITNEGQAIAVATDTRSVTLLLPRKRGLASLQGLLPLFQNSYVFSRRRRSTAFCSNHFPLPPAWHKSALLTAAHTGGGKESQLVS